MLEMQVMLILNGNDNAINLSKSHLKFFLFLKVLINSSGPQLCFSEAQIVIISFISSELQKNIKNIFLEQIYTRINLSNRNRLSFIKGFVNAKSINFGHF